MFGFLKEKLKKSVDRLADKLKAPEEKKQAKPGAKKPPARPGPGVKKAERAREIKEVEKPEIGPEEAAEAAEAGRLPEERKGLFARLKGKVVEKELTGKDIDSFFAETEKDLLQANIALEAVEHMRGTLKKELVSRKIKRRGAEQFIAKALEDSLLELVEQGCLDLDSIIRKARAEGRPSCFVFIGMNGGGKTTSIAKVAKYLMGKKYSVVLAAGDTFRAASIEQLEHHADRLGAKIIKHGYGADSASVIFDARKHAESRGIDVVLADTAGRTHVNENLMDELRKVMRVNKPELKILVVDSLTGNDAVEQAKLFDAGVGVDCVIMTKADVYEKGGSILSVSYAIKKPILFLGTGQGYDDLQKFEPGKFVKELME